MMYTIKDLSEGNCAVVNDGTLQELQKVLKLAFPMSGDVNGSAMYYFRYSNGILDSSLKNDNNFPTQSVKDFLKKGYPKVMWVSNLLDFSDKVKRVVFTEKNKCYLAWSDAETFEEAEQQLQVVAWFCAKDIEEPKEYTMQEIADALKIDVKDLKIKQ